MQDGENTKEKKKKAKPPPSKKKSGSALPSDVWTGAHRTEIKETRRTRQRDSMLTYRSGGE